MIVVLDTNVLVSALLSPFGPSARVLDLVLAGDIRLAYDDRIMAECTDVLGRPRFALDPSKVADLLEYLVAYGTAVTAPPLALTFPDPDDLPLLEVTAVTEAILVTGNRRHFPEDLCGEVTVVAPADFLAEWRAQPEGE